MKNIINLYPETSEYNGKLKSISGDNSDNGIFLVIYPEMNLSFVAVVKNKELLPLNVCIKNGDVVNITKDNKEFIFSDFNMSSGLSNVPSSSSSVSDFNEVNTTMKEVNDIDGNFLGYTPSYAKGNAIPGAGAYGMMSDMNFMNNSIQGYGDTFNKYAKLNRLDLEEIVCNMIKEANLEDKIFIADILNESSGGEIILPIETPIMKVAFNKSKDEVYGKYFKYAGKSKLEVKRKVLDEDDEEKMKPQINSTIQKAISLDKTNDEGENESEAPPIGNITITRIIRKVPVELSEINNGGIMANHEDSTSPVNGIIKRIIQLFSDSESFGVKNLSGNGVIYKKDGDCCFENKIDSLKGLMQPEEASDINYVKPEESAGKTIVIITRNAVTPPIKISHVFNDSAIGTVEVSGKEKKVKIAFNTGKDETFINRSEIPEILLGERSKIARIDKITDRKIKHVKVAMLDEEIYTGEEDKEKTASQKTAIKIFLKKDETDTFHISAHFSNTGRIFLKEVQVRNKEGVKEQLKELGVPAAQASEISNNAYEADTFAMTIDASAYSDAAQKISKLISDTEGSRDYFIEDREAAFEMAKVAYDITMNQNSPSDGLKILATSIIKKNDLKDSDEMKDEITKIISNLRQYGLYKKCNGDEEESAALFNASSTLEKAMSVIYL